MWFDTMRFRIEINEEQFERVVQFATKLYNFVDIEDGTNKERYTTRLGSWYAGLHIFYTFHYIDVEYSAHKWTKGVNGIAGIELSDRQNYAPLRWALQKIGIEYNESKIEVRRVDVGSLFRLSPLSEQGLWASVGRMHFPRRTASIWGSSIAWGTSNTLTYEKIYSKLPEQLKHKSTLPTSPRIPEYFDYLRGVIRYECEFRTKWLTNNNIKTIADLRNNMETLKLQFAKKENEKIEQLPFNKGKSINVEQALSRHPGLFKFWTEIMTYGHDIIKVRYEAQNNLGRFWARRKKLRDMNIPFMSIDPIAIPEYEEIPLQRIA